MSVWAKFKNYFFGVPLPASQPAPVEVKVPEKQPDVPVLDITAKKIDLKIDEAKQEVTLTVEHAPSVEVKAAEPEKKKAPVKKRTTKKKS